MKIQLSEHFTTKKLLQYALPSIGMMVFTSIYGVVDGFFVSNYAGKTQFAAVNLIMPFIMILASAGFMLGAGGTALVAMLLGMKDDERANRTFSMIVEVAVLCGVTLSVVGIILMKPIARLLGATGQMLPYCVLYGRIVIGFGTAFMLQQLFQTFFAAAEKPELGLKYTVAAGVTNMVLDALFVGYFRMGVAGAAVATGLSQCVGGVFPLIYFMRENDSLLHFRVTKIEWAPIGKACFNGVSEMASNIAMSVVGMAYNFQLIRFLGENGVAAYGVLMYVNFIFISVFIGFAMGTAPITAYHYGAQNKKELRNLLRKSIFLMAAVGAMLMAVAQLLAVPITKIYVGYDAELVKLTIHAFRICAFAFLFSGVCIYVSSFFTALNNGLISAVISLARTFGFELLSVMILPVLFGAEGIWFSILVAEVGAVAMGGIFLTAQRKRYGY